MPKAIKTTFDNKEKLVNHLKRYYTAKGYSIEVIRVNEPMDCSCSEFDLIMDDFNYAVCVTEPCKRKFYDREKNVKFWSKITKSLYKEIKKLVPVIKLDRDYHYTKLMIVEDFIHEMLTRKEIITKVLADLDQQA